MKKFFAIIIVALFTLQFVSAQNKAYIEPDAIKSYLYGKAINYVNQDNVNSKWTFQPHEIMFLSLKDYATATNGQIYTISFVTLDGKTVMKRKLLEGTFKLFIKQNGYEFFEISIQDKYPKIKEIMFWDKAVVKWDKFISAIKTKNKETISQLLSFRDITKIEKEYFFKALNNQDAYYCLLHSKPSIEWQGDGNSPAEALYFVDDYNNMYYSEENPYVIRFSNLGSDVDISLLNVIENQKNKRRSWK